MNGAFLLFSSVIVPFFLGLFLFFFPKISLVFQRSLALLGFSFPLIVAIFLFWGFQPSAETGYDYLWQMDTGLQSVLGISLHLGLNGIGLILYILAAVVSLAAGISAVWSRAERLGWYLGLLLCMQTGLLGVFASVDLFFIYFFYELAVIPSFVMMGIWGGAGRKGAAIEMAVFLTLGTTLSLLGLITLYSQTEVRSLDLIELHRYFAEHSFLGEGNDSFLKNNLLAFLLFGVGILASLFPLHSWAPRGYAEAPCSVAMLHAGVLNKFGLYLLIQVAVPFLPEGMGNWKEVLMGLALGNIIIIGLVTLAQKNLKSLLGYSSVMHMGYGLLGIASMSVLGVSGTVLLLFANGLSVALLFLLATVIHQRIETMDFQSMGGLAGKVPLLSAFFVAAIFASIGLPGFANFWGELAIFFALGEHPWILFLAATGIIISAIYGLRAVAAIFYGKPTEPLEAVLRSKKIKDLVWVERLPAILLLICLIVVGVYPSLISDPLNKGVITLFSEINR